MKNKSQRKTHITTLNEKPLHASLKQWYALPGDRLEVKIDKFYIDILRQDLLIEIQTRNFSSLKRKLTWLLRKGYSVRLVHPIAKEKWLVKIDADGTILNRRKSPKHGSLLHLFDELVFIPHLMTFPNFEIEVLLIQQEETRIFSPGKAWRRNGWVTKESRLLDVIKRYHFQTPEDIAIASLPSLDVPFTSYDLMQALSISRSLAQKIAYCLRKMGSIRKVGKQGNAYCYVRNNTITSVPPP